MADKKLEVKNLRVTFKTDHGLVQAVRDVSFDLYEGETLCIVGESGSGKSVTSKTIMQILANNAIIENGSIIYEGENLLEVSEEEFYKIRGHKIGMIFQDPLSSLNPIVRIGKQITEATLINADKFKKMYEELISKELIAYKNCIAHANIKIKKAKDKYYLNELNAKKAFESQKEEIYLQHVGKELNAYNECLAKIESEIKANNKKTKVEINQIEDQIRELNSQIDTINKTLLKDVDKLKRDIKKDKSKKAELTSQIKESKDIAKRKVASTNAQINELKVSINNKNTELKELNLKVHSNYAQELTELRDALNKVKASGNEAVKEFQKTYSTVLAQLKKEKEETDKYVNEIKVKMNEELPPLKSALDERKAQAKQEVKEFKTKITNEHNAKVEEIKSQANKALETATEEQAKEIKAKLKEDLNQANIEFIDKTKITKAEAKRRAIEIMREVGIPMPERRFKQYPFEFSGGMRQRIVIAIALTASPDVLICDEPTTALDVTIQAQILELINKLKRERNLSCIFITHDLGVVANMADRVAVMYAGKIVEYGTAEEIFYDPRHPYTWALLSSIPDVDSKEKLEAIPGTPPDMIYPPKGDAFALRSHYAMNIDFEHQPPFFKVSDTHYAATWLLHPDAPKVEMPKIVSERIKNAKKGGQNE